MIGIKNTVTELKEKRQDFKNKIRELDKELGSLGDYDEQFLEISGQYLTEELTQQELLDLTDEELQKIVWEPFEDYSMSWVRKQILKSCDG